MVSGIRCRVSDFNQITLTRDYSQRRILTMKSFRELRIWEAAMNLVEKIYQITRDFPKEELYGLTSQLRRAAVSIPSNIAEGHTREHLKEYLHHISMAQASLAEVDTQLEIGLRLRYVSATRLDPMQSDLSSLGRQLYSLRNSLTKKNTISNASNNQT